MFVKAGKYLINTENVTHIQVDDDGSAVVFFIGGQMIRLTTEEATPIFATLDTAFTTRSVSRIVPPVS